MTDTPCIGNDPFCPCQDGDLCHYKDSPDGKTKAMASAAGEPVAWTSWMNGPCEVTKDKHRADSWAANGGDVRPLFLHPAAPAPTWTQGQIDAISAWAERSLTKMEASPAAPAPFCDCPPSRCLGRKVEGCRWRQMERFGWTPPDAAPAPDAAVTHQELGWLTTRATLDDARAFINEKVRAALSQLDHPAAPAEPNLREFAREILDDFPDSFPDGFGIQDLAIKHGILAGETRTKPCREEGCYCAEYHGDDMSEGVTCYRLAPSLFDAHPAAPAPDKEKP